MSAKYAAVLVPLVFASAALAADLPSKTHPIYPPAVPIFTWTGLYVGAQIGYEFGLDQRTATAVTGASASSASAPKTVTVGGHVGYNYAMPPIGSFGTATVAGFEGDVNVASAQKAYSLGTVTGSYHEQIQGSARGRLGVAFNRFLVYGTGGAAFGGIRNIYTLRGIQDYYAKDQVGYTIGAGIEYALAYKWSLRGEYRYTDFGSYSQLAATGTASALSVHHRDYDNRFQVGVTYHFITGEPATVVARY